MTREEIRRIAEDITARHETRDPFLLCRRMGIEIIYVPLTQRVRAFYQRIHGVDVIYLSDKAGEEEGRVLLAHELGHCLLHRGLNAFFVTRSTLYPVGRFESEADEFARCLLKNSDIDLSLVDRDVRNILIP